MGPLALQEGAKHPQGEEVIHFIQKAFRRLRQVVHELRRIKKAVRLFALRANKVSAPARARQVFLSLRGPPTVPAPRATAIRASPVVCS